MTSLAIYDMDKTITRRPTYVPFMAHAVRRLAPWRALLLPAVGGTVLAYAVKAIDRGRLKELNQAILLGRHSDRSELAAIAGSFADRTMRTNVLPGALARIAEDRAAGRRLVLATASSRLYTAAIADRLGFDDVVATNNLEGLDGRIRAKIDGENAFGPAKLRMIKAWLAGEGIARADCHVRFYSDHASDVCVMDWADEPFAVNAHDRLRVIALARGWPMLDWR